ncbi:LGFP repeat-containing protein, partial [Mesorhizobium japonicum]|uniref:LGFP repeat-containing protein n=1 Tax=Mesorhizobium japonicum TaxID=2066070 RepID=UPI003B595B57
TWQMPGDRGAAFAATEGNALSLGAPAADWSCAAGTCSQPFTNGVIVQAATGTFGLAGDIATAWRGGGRIAAGDPTSPELCGLTNGGCLQRFANGSYYWSPSSGAHFVPTGSMAAWGSLGYEYGSVGYPTS